jgi:shikimate dehydrogenase
MTDRYAVIGNPVAHSRSPDIHAAFARQTGQDMAYGRILAPVDGFAAAVDAFRAEGGRGLNVTIPFKLDAFAYSTRRTPRAEAAGAVNTLRFEPDAGVLGDNTDGAGLVRDLQANLGVRLAGTRVLVAGAGGATQGVVLPLLDAGVGELVIANRTVARAVDLVARFTSQGPVQSSGYAELAGLRFDVIVNATAASIAGEALPLPAGLCAPGATAYDMMYGKGETPFLAWARAQGAAVVSDGLGMLVEQAAESFLLWRGVRPDTAPVLASLRAG